MTSGDLARQSGATRLIIPAPVETTNERGIMWYEVVVNSEIDSMAPANRQVVASAVTRLTAEREFETVISDPRGDVTIGLAINGDADEPRLDFVVNGQATTLYGRTAKAGIGRIADSSSCSLTQRLELAPDERAIIGEWNRLAPSLLTLAQASRQSWGCTACVLLGGSVAVSGGGCVGLAAALNPGAIGACAAALATGATFAENCPGSCADAAATAVTYLGMIGVDV